MKIESSRVGSVEVRDQDIISFPSGLIGLARRNRFVVLEFAEDVPLGWLQSVDDPNFGMPVAEPGIFVSDYSIETSASEVAELGLKSVHDCAILIVTTIGAGGAIVTGNLRAPLLVNAESRIGRQVVLSREDLDLHALVDPVAFAQAPTFGTSARPDGVPVESAAS
jgi:flagellar assembly factor FliW